MNISREIKKRFGGGWNTILLILILMVCLRFSGAEWKEEGLDVRFLRGIYLLLAVIGLGILIAGIKLFIARLDSPSYWMNSADEVFASGLKLGILVGGIFVFFVGILLVDNFLGPFQGVIDTILEKLAGKLPGG